MSNLPRNRFERGAAAFTAAVVFGLGATACSGEKPAPTATTSDIQPSANPGASETPKDTYPWVPIETMKTAEFNTFDTTFSPKDKVNYLLNTAFKKENMDDYWSTMHNSSQAVVDIREAPTANLSEADALASIEYAQLQYGLTGGKTTTTYATDASGKMTAYLNKPEAAKIISSLYPTYRSEISKSNGTFDIANNAIHRSDALNLGDSTQSLVYNISQSRIYSVASSDGKKTLTEPDPTTGATTQADILMESRFPDGTYTNYVTLQFIPGPDGKHGAWVITKQSKDS